MRRKLTDASIAQQVHIAHLNDFPPRLACHARRLVYFVLLAAKITIVGSWKWSVTTCCLKHKNSWIMVHEWVTSVINDKQALFNQTWEPWATYIKGYLYSTVISRSLHYLWSLGLLSSPLSPLLLFSFSFGLLLLPFSILFSQFLWIYGCIAGIVSLSHNYRKLSVFLYQKIQ